MNMDVEKAIREYLPEVVHLSLATARDNAPWVCEVHFAYDDDLNLYFRSLKSRLHSQEIAQNPKVAGNIVRQHTLDDSPVGVYFEGKANMLEPGEQQNRAFQCLSQRLHIRNAILEEANNPQGHQFYKITVDCFYLFDGASGQKYQLPWNGGKK